MSSKKSKVTPETDLELSIRALEVYNIEPNIIKSMLANLGKISNNKPLICPCCGAELNLEVKPITNRDILNAVNQNNGKL